MTTRKPPGCARVLTAGGRRGRPRPLPGPPGHQRSESYPGFLPFPKELLAAALKSRRRGLLCRVSKERGSLR